MSVLATPLSLGDGPGRIEDVEALVRKVVDDRLRQWGARLRELDREDCVSYLIGVAWELSCRYDRKKDRVPNLAAYTARILSLRVADWYRQRFGDTRHGEKPIVLSLDAPAALGLPGSDSQAEGGDRLVDTLRAGAGDPADDRAPDLVGILNGRSGPDARAHLALGEPAAGGAADGDRSANPPGQPRRVKPRVPPTFARRSNKPPVCAECFSAFHSAFVKVNRKVAKDSRLTPAQLEDKAAKRAQAVRFGSEWACPRHTKLEDEHAQQLMLEQAYPKKSKSTPLKDVCANRAERRALAGGSKSRKTQPRQPRR